ncbi:MAG TPA: hypothetical protein VH478_00090 [Trebonia sp.]|jgi:hypothetical protein|nr:hypothetical protein [Trebonia sp.]
MGSMRARGLAVPALTALATLTALAGLTACAAPGAPAAGRPAIFSTATTPAAAAAGGVPGAPIPVASAVVSAASLHPAAPATPTRKPATRPSATPPPAGGTSAGTPVTAGNPAGHAAIPAGGGAVDASHPDHVIGDGTPAGCTAPAVVAAVAEGGVIAFSCGAAPVTITMTGPATVSSSSHLVVLDGGGKVTLSGGGRSQILTMDPGWQQQWPRLVVQNLAFTGAYSGTQQVQGSSVYGGGAIFAGGGQLAVVNSAFSDDSCYASGPDLGGGAIRAVGMDPAVPVYITGDTFTDDSCSNGGALSGLFAHFEVVNSLFAGDKAIGWGANPAAAGTAGGGSGGAIYTDGTGYDLTVAGTDMHGNTAREGGGAIFYVVNSGAGTLAIDSSTLADNPSGAFQNAPGIFDSVDGHDTPPSQSGSSIG